MDTAPVGAYDHTHVHILERGILDQHFERMQAREVLAELAQGKSNGAIAESLVLTKRAVEKHINAIFMKLNLAAPDDVSRRVKAALVYLASEDGHSS